MVVEGYIWWCRCDLCGAGADEEGRCACGGQYRKIQCTCDDNCDEPCPVHAWTSYMAYCDFKIKVKLDSIGLRVTEIGKLESIKPAEGRKCAHVYQLPDRLKSGACVSGRSKGSLTFKVVKEKAEDA